MMNKKNKIDCDEAEERGHLLDIENEAISSVRDQLERVGVPNAFDRAVDLVWPLMQEARLAVEQGRASNVKRELVRLLIPAFKVLVQSHFACEAIVAMRRRMMGMPLSS